MPVVQVRLSDLERLVGRRLSPEDAERYIITLKGEIERIEGDIIEYEATHDRPDLFSAEGLARAIQGLAGIEEGLPKFAVRASGLELLAERVEIRPWVAGCVIRGLELDDEAIRQIMQLQEKLHATYCRGRRRASIGVYDLDTIKPPIRYIAAPRDQVRFRPLEWEREATADEILREHPKGVEYGHLLAGADRVPLLVDSEGKVLSMPPIVNSEDTKVTEDTKNVFIDVTGTDPKVVLEVLTIVATSVAERAGRRLELVRVRLPDRTMETPALEISEFELNVKYAADVIGIELTAKEAGELLRRMRHDVEEEGGRLRVRVAPYRIDVLHPIDLVEDIAMAYGYDRLEPELPRDHFTIGRCDPIEEFSRMVRELMCGLGFEEVANYMFTNERDLLTKMRLPKQPVVKVTNPISERFTVIRTWLLPGLLNVLACSKGCGYPQRIFECGDVVEIDPKSETRTKEDRRLAAAIASPEITMVDAMVALGALLRTLGLEYEYKPARHPSFIEGRCGEVWVGDEKVGIIGEIHPEVLEAFELEVPVAAFELSVSKLYREYVGRMRL